MQVQAHFNDIPADQTPTWNSTEQKQIPSCDSRSPLMKKVQITNRTLNQNFVGCHTKPRNDATRQEGAVVLRERSPDTTCKHDDYSYDKYWPSSPYFGKWIGKKKGQTNSVWRVSTMRLEDFRIIGCSAKRTWESARLCSALGYWHWFQDLLQWQQIQEITLVRKLRRRKLTGPQWEGQHLISISTTHFLLASVSKED